MPYQRTKVVQLYVAVDLQPREECVCGVGCGSDSIESRVPGPRRDIGCDICASVSVRRESESEQSLITTLYLLAALLTQSSVHCLVL